MRTLLDESLPPDRLPEQPFATAEPVQRVPRTFSPKAVLANVDNLSEVGLAGTVIATPGASQPKTANDASARGRPLSSGPANSSGPAEPALDQSLQTQTV